ncbi:putative Enhancer of rudimentary-like protein [Hypsibius exemplaris]|uniref:Enhancer of rudimentary-like protein n=1 Tax=Hypsibius exemplaris TaxID=2072580 RepID=A0A1W0WGB7_HYPEX|nr:putative Enhancer of rudimentary-like protein [Hypsibius exemplaris]
MSHCVLLLQTTKDPGSRTYSDYEDEDAALREICNLFETLLRKSQPGRDYITYDIRDLYDFIDRLEDLAIMINQEVRGSKLYLPRGKQFIKEAIYDLLIREREKNSQIR